MIVLDQIIENDPIVLAAIRRLTPGQIVELTSLLSGVIKDDAVPRALLLRRRCTFLTINVDDFWRKQPTHRAYSIVCVRIAQDETGQLRSLLGPLLRHRVYRHSRPRCRKVFLVSRAGICFYRRLHGPIELLTSHESFVTRDS